MGTTVAALVDRIHEDARVSKIALSESKAFAALKRDPYLQAAVPRRQFTTRALAAPARFSPQAAALAAPALMGMVVVTSLAIPPATAPVWPSFLNPLRDLITTPTVRFI